MSFEDDAACVSIVNLSGEVILRVQHQKNSQVYCLMDDMPAANLFGVWSLIFDGAEMDPLSTFRAAGLMTGDNTVTAVWLTKDSLADRGCSPNMLLNGPSKMERAARRLRIQPYSVRELRAAGYRLDDLAASCTPLKLLSGGYTAKDFRDAGFPAHQIKSALVGLLGREEASAIAKDLLDAGYTLPDFHEASFTLSELRKLSCFSPKELEAAGYTLRDFCQANYSAAELESLGVSVRQLKVAGYSTSQLREAGYTAGQLKLVGYTLIEVRHAGYPVAELRDAGYNPWVLSSCGISAKELRAGGFGAQELQSAGILIDAVSNKRQRPIQSPAARQELSAIRRPSSSSSRSSGIKLQSAGLLIAAS